MKRPMPSHVRDAVMERYGWRCARCGDPATEVHHRLYRSRGGTNHPVNLVALCSQCHRDVHATSEAPYVVGGYMDREGRYVGPSEEYRREFGDGRLGALGGDAA